MTASQPLVNGSESKLLYNERLFQWWLGNGETIDDDELGEDDEDAYDVNKDDEWASLQMAAVRGDGLQG